MPAATAGGGAENGGIGRGVRCVAGAGVVDFASILKIVRGNGHSVTPGIESAAQATRTVPLLDSDWWSTYPPRTSVELLGPLRILWEQGRPASEPYSSPWERDADGLTVLQDEWDVVVRSVNYFRRIEETLKV